MEQNPHGDAYYLNKFGMSLWNAQNLAAFKADERAYLERFPMSDEQRQAVLDRDLDRMVALGGTFPALTEVFEERDHVYFKPGLTPDETLATLEAACAMPGSTLWITPQWFVPFRARLRAALPPNLTESIIVGLHHAIYKRQSLEKVIEFIEQQPLTWEEFEQQEHQRFLESRRKGFFPWPDVEAAANDPELNWMKPSRRADSPSDRDEESVEDMIAERDGCPGCGRPAPELKCMYFSSPAWTWENQCGCAGWLIVCEPCHMQVDFITVVNS